MFREILMGEIKPDRVHFVELSVDDYVINYVAEKLMKQKNTLASAPWDKKAKLFLEGGNASQLLEEEKLYYKKIINFYYLMGYDYVPVWEPSALLLVLISKSRITYTAGRLRAWVEENEGLIKSWEDFENFPWDRIKLDIEDYLKFFCDNLPEGMKITFTSSLYEWVGERFLGYVGMFQKLYLEPDLVKAVFDKWGQIVYEQYKKAVSFDCVGAIFHGDDLGYKKGTMLSPNMLREIVFPWFKKYSSLAHQHGKMYWYHCCGNVLSVIEDLIEDVKIDAFHSFQDVIMPVWKFKEKYGDRVAVLGGVDVDKLTRFDRETLRRYVRKILDKCMPGGRYGFGSGNSITNYVPPENYLTMLEEGLKWRPIK